MSSTSLHDAAEAGKTNQAQDLITNGADVNAKDRGDWTPLHYAVEKDHTEIVRILVTNGADVHVENFDRDTPLDYSRSNTMR